MLKKWLTEKLILLNLEAADWRQAVYAGGALLHQAGKCTPGYIDAMVRTIEELGPYMVFAPGMVLAHARPEDGVHENGVSLITLKTPVFFGNKANDPVELIFSFCAKDRNSHVALLKALADFLREETHPHLLREAQAVDQVMAAFDI
jgi:mannitol/fructose-specific phosphotransferase system IIA component (Ntr-type)